MSYTQLPDRSTSDTNSAADVNQLQDNIEAIKGGTGSTAPTTTIEDLADDKLAIADIDDTPADDADTAVSSKWTYDNLYNTLSTTIRDKIDDYFRLITSAEKTANYTITDTDRLETIRVGDNDGDITITLPTASDNTDREITIYNNNSYSYNGSNDNDRKVLLQTEGSETINGVDTTSGGDPIEIEHQYCGLTVKSDGSNWVIVGTIGECEIRTIEEDTTGNESFDTKHTLEFIYERFLTGTLDNDDTTSIAHGLSDIDKIYALSVDCYDDTNSMYRVKEHYRSNSSSREYAITLDATNIVIGGVASDYRTHTYKIFLKYWI